MILDMQGSVGTARKPPLSRVVCLQPSGPAAGTCGYVLRSLEDAYPSSLACPAAHLRGCDRANRGACDIIRRARDRCVGHHPAGHQRDRRGAGPRFVEGHARRSRVVDPRRGADTAGRDRMALEPGRANHRRLANRVGVARREVEGRYQLVRQTVPAAGDLSRATQPRRQDPAGRAAGTHVRALGTREAALLRRRPRHRTLLPILAASKLMKKAQKANNLRGDGEITDRVAALAKQHGVAVVKPEATLEIKEPRQAVKAFAASGPDGIACLGLVLDAVEHELPNFRARANAWATGDIETLRKVPESAYRETCQSAITGAGFAKSLGIDNLPARVEGAWLAAADTALATNRQSFAVLPMHDLLDPHGYLAALQARGYVVTAPDASLSDDPLSAAGTAPVPASSMH